MEEVVDLTNNGMRKNKVSSSQSSKKRAAKKPTVKPAPNAAKEAAIRIARVKAMLDQNKSNLPAQQKSSAKRVHFDGVALSAEGIKKKTQVILLHKFFADKLGWREVPKAFDDAGYDDIYKSALAILNSGESSVKLFIRSIMEIDSYLSPQIFGYSVDGITQFIDDDELYEANLKQISQELSIVYHSLFGTSTLMKAIGVYMDLRNKVKNVPPPHPQFVPAQEVEVKLEENVGKLDVETQTEKID